MAEAPAFQWYPKDCDTDENIRLMSNEELGFYVRCLNHAWVNRGLPESLEEIGRLVYLPASKVNKLWVRVGRCFELIGGRWCNARQERQRTEQANFRLSRSSAAQHRWSKQVECKPDALALHVDCKIDASAVHVECSDTASDTASDTEVLKPLVTSPIGSVVLDLPPNVIPKTSEVVFDPGKKRYRPASPEMEEWFAAFWALYWRKVAKDAARKSFNKRVKCFDDWATIHTALLAQKPEMLAREMDKRPHAATWLNQGRMFDEIPEAVHVNGVSPTTSAFHRKWEGL